MVVSGLIRPPPEIRAVADRTALYVAKNGRAFETKIINSAKGQTPRFAFLHTTSPFHAYYQDKIQFYEGGGTDKPDVTAVSEEKLAREEETNTNEIKKDEEKAVLGRVQSTPPERTTRTGMIDPIVKALLSHRAHIASIDQQQKEKQDSHVDPTCTLIPPPPLTLIQMVPPASLTVLQLETMQAVAQFVALSSLTPSVNLLQILAAREWSNPTFAFCQPRHGYFAYFSSLVDAYRSVLRHLNSSDRIDSFDLPVSELSNGPKECLQTVAYRAEYQRYLLLKEPSNQSEDALAVKIDWQDFVVVETIDFLYDEVVELSPLPSSTEAAMVTNFDIEMDRDNENEEAIRVVPSYTPKIVAASEASNTLYVIDPISGKSISVKDMPEHMRIQLLDPKWAEERKKFQEKQRESNLVSGDVVAANLEKLAQQRGDRFGKTEHKLLKQDSNPREKIDESNLDIFNQAAQPSVGPVLPTERRESPELDSLLGSVEPAAKRPKITYAPSVLAAAAQASIAERDENTQAGVALPPSSTPEDPFLIVATGEAAIAAEQTSQIELIPEDDFAASNQGKVMLQIRVPNDPSQMAWNFYGQIVTVTLPSVAATVKHVKNEVSRQYLNDMPASKIQLRHHDTGFLKDALTLAALNIGPSTASILELVPRSRGGKKK